MISSVGFVPPDVLKSHPSRADVTKDDLEALRHRLNATMHQPDADSDSDVSIDDTPQDPVDAAIEKARDAAAHLAVSGFAEDDPEIEEAMKELRFDTYDSDDDITKTDFLDRIVSIPEEVVLKPDGSDADSETEDSESVGFEKGDIVFLATRAEDILSSIEVYLYEDADDQQGGNLMVHHDIPLAHYPVCCAYLDVYPGNTEKPNLVAVGGMGCDIEIYDLDVLDPVSPITTLPSSSKKQRSTMALAVNDHFRNVMVSGNDDKRIRIWDLYKGEVTSDLKLHRSSIQCLRWNPNDPPILISGGHDRRCRMIDARTPDGEIMEWELSSDNECLSWCTDQKTCFLASDEEGTVHLFDARKGSCSTPLFNLMAHKDNTTVVDVCPIDGRLFLTGSEDGKVKIWNMHGAEPQLMEKKNLSVGGVMAGGFCKYAGHLVTAAGDNGQLHVWDIRSSSKIVNDISEAIYIPKIYKPNDPM